MITDPSWLYSTIAQSSAAIVAIIGGFITASVLMLMSEKRGLQKQKSEKETHIQAIKDKRAELQYIYDTNKAERFIRNELAKYSDDNIPTLDKILDNYPSDYSTFFNKNILEKEFLKLSLKQVKAKLFMLKHADRIDVNKYDSFLEWVKNKVSTEDYIEIVGEYDKYIERQKKSESASNDASTLPPWVSSWGSNIIQKQLDIDKKERELKEEEKHRSEQDNIYSGIKKLDYQIFLINHELENLNSRLGAFQYPQGLGWGIIVLAFLAVFCVLVPVIIIAFNAFYPWAQILTTFAFWIGIIGVFAYIVFQIRALRRK
ncbi:hypothetical protein ES703_60400 [subsurface metagenome]